MILFRHYYYDDTRRPIIRWLGSRDESVKMLRSFDACQRLISPRDIPPSDIVAHEIMSR